MDRPSVGRIVRYVMPNKDIRPAIITRVVEGDTVGLHLFLDANDSPMQPIDAETGMAGIVRYAPAGESYIIGTWHWPART